MGQALNLPLRCDVMYVAINMDFSQMLSTGAQSVSEHDKSSLSAPL